MDDRDLPSLLYGLLDLLLAAAYLYLILALAPSRSATIQTVAVGASLLWAAGGVGMISRTSFGRRIALVASLSLIVVFLLLLILLVSSAAYLHGIYDGIGQAGVVIALLAALLSFEVVGLVPALQLVHLRRLARRARETGRR
jgi:hypothetical protein